jgi:hypothetical protein
MPKSKSKARSKPKANPFLEIPRKDRTFLDFIRMQQAGLDPGDETGRAILDGMLEQLGGDERLLKTRHPTLLHLLTFGASEIRKFIAKTYGISEFTDKKHLVVKVEPDQRLDAQVEAEPPYAAYVSSNLFLYTSRVGELMMGGLGLGATDGSERHDPQFTTEEAGLAIREMLDRFIAGGDMPDKEHWLGGQYGLMHTVAMFSILAFIICHEFAHIVNHELRRRGSEPPMRDFSEGRLKPVFSKLINSSLHDPDGRIGLSSLSEEELQKVYESWLDEVMADVLSADMTIRYVKEDVVFRNDPMVGGYARLGIHFSMAAQFFYHVYRSSQDDKHPMISKTHPPIDFREYCVHRAIYGNEYLEVVKPYNDYAKELLRGIYLRNR